MELVLLIVFRNNNLDDYGNLRMITRTDPLVLWLRVSGIAAIILWYIVLSVIVSKKKEA